ncbi:hypothetical protein BGZ54_004662 [Gamsiella multidivaricata]|nr:hypothetical protein BGZ54_004662 [Gamsiella multidivaricata]
MNNLHIQTKYRRIISIGNGLIMRWSTKADTDNVINLWMRMPLGDPLPEDSVPGPNEFMKAGARRLLSGKNAAMSEYDYALVEDTRCPEEKNPIIACVSLHRYVAYYGSVDIHIGKPELIATNPEYRSQGFVRRLLMEMVHPESEARGDVLQFIGGIENFYRQFGYEYALYMTPAGLIESPDVVPALAKGNAEPYILRMATEEDLPFLNRLGVPGMLHLNAQVGIHYTPEYWRWTVHDAYQDKRSRFDTDRDTRIIVEAASGKAVGFTVVSRVFMGPQLELMALEDDATYLDVYEPVLRQLFVHAKERQDLADREREAFMKKSQPPKEPATTTTLQTTATTVDATTNTTASTEKPESTPFQFYFALHERHPVTILLGTKIKYEPKNVPGWSFYTRIPSYPIFIKKVAPELEKRLAKSALAGFTGRLRLDFFRYVEGCSGKGLEIFFEKGRITDATEWVKPSPEKQFEEKLAWKKEGKKPVIHFATFPPLTFSLLLMGKQSLKNLEWAYGDVSLKDDSTRLLLNILFPKTHHHIDVYSW